MYLVFVFGGGYEWWFVGSGVGDWLWLLGTFSGDAAAATLGTFGWYVHDDDVWSRDEYR